MFLLDKALASAVRSGQMDRRELVNDLLRNNNVMELAERLADYVIAYEEPRPIVVSQEEYDRIVGLFKILTISRISALLLFIPSLSYIKV